MLLGDCYRDARNQCVWVGGCRGGGQVLLGDCYRDGAAVPEDLAKAAACYRLAMNIILKTFYMNI